MIDILSAAIGASLAAGIIYLVGRHLFPMPNLSGEWQFTERTDATEYADFENIHVTYSAMLTQDGHTLTGTGEKVREKNSDGPHKYFGDKRNRITLTGAVVRRGLRTFRIAINYVEQGRIRESSTSHTLSLQSGSRLKGSFSKTAADSKGRVIWRRTSTCE